MNDKVAKPTTPANPAASPKPASPAIETVTLKRLCAELKIEPREARERLRLAVRDAKKNPELSKSHKPGHAWEWPKNSPALNEVRAALAV